MSGIHKKAGSGTIKSLGYGIRLAILQFKNLGY
jgi:hypothetical protein